MRGTITTGMDDCCDLSSLLKGDHDATSLGPLAVAGFWAIWRGESPPISNLLDPHGSGDVLPRLLEAGRIQLDQRKRLRGIHGLTLETTPHQIRHDEGPVYTWCALDAIGIPAALGIDAKATTSCARCGRSLVVRIAAGVPDGEAALTLWVPQSGGTHLLDDFCRHANLFCSLEHLEQHRLTRGRPITVNEAADLGRMIWADVIEGRGGGHQRGAAWA